MVVEIENVDIWIKLMGIVNYCDDVLVGWLFNYFDIEFLSKGEDFN